jgi:hypothetical protein
MLYGFFEKDYTLVLGNFLAVLLGLAYTLLTIPLATRSQQTHITAAIFFTFLVTFSASILSTFLDDELPIVCAGILAVLLFYASPIMEIRRVVRMWNASSIHLPLAVMAVINSVCVLYPDCLTNVVGVLRIRGRKRMDMGPDDPPAYIGCFKSWMSADSSREE